MAKKWEVYDRLIEAVPRELTVQDVVVGCAWTMIKTEVGCGVALTVRQRAGRELMPDSIIGKSLRDAAALCKSWNFIEASIGMAAINARFNHPKRVESLGILPRGEDSRRKSDVFSLLGDEVRGKKVTVIGHFPNLEKQLRPVSELTVLEREPQSGRNARAARNAPAFRGKRDRFVSSRFFSSGGGDKLPHAKPCVAVCCLFRRSRGGCRRFRAARNAAQATPENRKNAHARAARGVLLRGAQGND